MSSAPEILIADNVSVLEEIRSSSVKTVSYDASNDDEFLSVVSSLSVLSNAEFSAAYGIKEGQKTLSMMSKSYVRAEEFGFGQVRAKMDGYTQKFNVISRDVMGPHSHLFDRQINLYPSGDREDKLYRPHVDPDVLALLFSFNEGVDSTLCVPHRFAGEEDKRERYFYPDADLSKAVALPGVSVSIIKLGEQVHYAPVPSDWRCTAHVLSVNPLELLR